MKVKELISLLEALPEEVKELALLGQSWDSEKGLPNGYNKITSIRVEDERGENGEDGATANSILPAVILVQNPEENKVEKASNDSPAGKLPPNLW